MGNSYPYKIIVLLAFFYRLNTDAEISGRFAKEWTLKFHGSSRTCKGIPKYGCGAVLYFHNIKHNVINEVWFDYLYLTHCKSKSDSTYQGLILGLNQAVKMNLKHLSIEGDSNQIIKQFIAPRNGRDEEVLQLHNNALILLEQIDTYQFNCIHIAENGRSYELSKLAIDLFAKSPTGIANLPEQKQLESPSDITNVNNDSELPSIILKQPSKTPPSDSNLQTNSTDIMQSKTYILQFDGGSRGNPGISGSGAILMDSSNNNILWKGNVYLGDGITNNIAEYQGIILGLQECIKHSSISQSSLTIQGDSTLIIKQLLGEYQVKNKHLKELHEIAINLLSRLHDYKLEYIPRALNVEADVLANLAMDTRRNSSIYF
eukprot:gene11685-24472_t